MAPPAEPAFANGMFSVYVDPGRVDPDHFFDGEISRYVAISRIPAAAAPMKY